MSRLTKPILKSAINNAVLGDGTGVSQMVLTRPANEAFRRAVAGQVVPGGEIISRNPGESGTIYSKNLFGDVQNRAAGSPPSYDPKFVSVNPYLNPYWDYIIDKISEGTAFAHQQWQVRQRLRGHVDKHDRFIEVDSHLPFQTEVAIEDQSDWMTRGDIIDTTQRDFQQAVDPRALALLMIAQAAQNVNTSPEALGGLDPDQIPIYEEDPQASLSFLTAAVSKILMGASISLPAPQLEIHSDIGKYDQPIKAQPPAGEAFAGLFIFETWKKIVQILQNRASEFIPSATKLSAQGVGFARNAVKSILGNK